MAERLLITLDTNQLDDWRVAAIRDACLVPRELAIVTVSARERGSRVRAHIENVVAETMVWGESRWDEAVWGGATVPETFVIGESRLDEGVLAGASDVDVFEQALKIVSSGSFPRPGDREQLTAGQRRHMRDAMIFTAHVRTRRHVLITTDRDLQGEPRRSGLQRIGRTRVMRPDEFVALDAAGQAALLDPAFPSGGVVGPQPARRRPTVCWSRVWKFTIAAGTLLGVWRTLPTGAQLGRALRSDRGAVVRLGI